MNSNPEPASDEPAKERFRWWHHLSWRKGFHAGWNCGLESAVWKYDEQHEDPPGSARAILIELMTRELGGG